MWVITVLPVYARTAWPLSLYLPNTAYQGDMIIGRSSPAAEVVVDGMPAAVGRDGYFAVGIDRLRPSDLLVSARDGQTEVRRMIRILARKWDIQHVDGLARQYVHPDPEQVRRIAADNRLITDVRKSPPSSDAWFLSDGFIMPVHGRVSSVFGSQRILNGEPRSPHRGIDIAANRGTPVKSPADGIVRLAAPDLFLMGNTLMVDHGLGVRSTFIHLDRILVQAGERVSQGQAIATVGSTGRATGPHLHWSVSIGTILVDPGRLPHRRFMIP
jgi:murein DD-endopeptidase MepM/ murein hydrolase activator NlpD